MLRLTSLAELDRLRPGRDLHGLVSVIRERDIQPAVLEALRRHPKVAWAMRQNTAAGYLITHEVFRRLVAGGALREDEARFMQFGWKGQLDNTGQLKGGRRLDVEVKAPSGRLRDEQAATIEAIRAAGGVAFVARSAADVFTELEQV